MTELEVSFWQTEILEHPSKERGINSGGDTVGVLLLIWASQTTETGE